MSKSHSLFANNQAQGQKIAGIYSDINSELIDLMQSGKLNPKPLMVCGGGTSSRCAAEGHWTLDLRQKFKEVKFFKESNEILIGAGVSMHKLLDEASKFGRSFPIGISGSTGIGYILTGGISPLSRQYGLAIDQILEIKGFWGNGDKFNLSRPNLSSNVEHKLKWRALCGAAPFLGIVTHLRLRTQKLNQLKIWEITLNSEELIETIQIVEEWPYTSSIFWVWGNKIKVFGVYECGKDDDDEFYKLIRKIPRSNEIAIYSASNLNQLNQLGMPKEIAMVPSLEEKYSEVVGMLGPKLKTQTTELIKTIEKLILNRPNQFSYIASQQLGGATNHLSREISSFVHRDAIWKPWITGTWDAEDIKGREKTINWIEEVWDKLAPYFPGIHLAQIHPHLTFHKREIKAAFGEWLPELQQLKSKYDPKGILPPL